MNSRRRPKLKSDVFLLRTPLVIEIWRCENVYFSPKCCTLWEHDTHTFCGGATHIRIHVCDKFTCEDDAFMKIKEKALAEKIDAETKKKQKSAEAELDCAGEVKVKAEAK